MLRYHGGKWTLGPRIVAKFPPHTIYVEPYGGAASVLMQKAPCYSEVYNDLDEEIVNVFSVLREPELARELERLIRLTPFAKQEFDLSFEPCDDPVEQARRTIARAFMGFSSTAAHHTATRTGFRSNACRSYSTPAHDWANYPDYIRGFCERLKRVVVDCRPAIDVVRQHDSRVTLFYVDPPYVHDTRKEARTVGKKGQYRHEMTDEDHVQLARVLRRCEGMVMLSGYPGDLYRELYGDWNQMQMSAFAGAAGSPPRTEVLWFNQAAWSAAHPRLDFGFEESF